MAQDFTGVVWTTAGIWVAAFLTLAVYSFLYKDNPLYKIAEHLFVGVSAGYGAVILYYQGVLTRLYDPLLKPLGQSLASLVSSQHTPAWGEVGWVLIVPTVLGLMFFGRFFPGWQWTARWPIALNVAVYAGLAIPLMFQAFILEQLYGTLDPLVPGGQNPTVLALDWVGYVVLLVAVLSTLAYFYFSAPHRGALGVAGKIGLWFIMIAFGAGFGNTVMARLALVIGRLQFLLDDWLTPTLGVLGSWLGFR
jgi:hypothetical protein